MTTIKQAVDSLVAAGTPLSDIIRQVNVAAIDKALVMNYGNQTKAAQQLNCHRHVVRKYTLVRQEKPMVGRWRDNTGEPVIRKGKIQVEYPCGGTSLVYSKDVNWSLDLTPNNKTGFSEKIVRWRPFYV